MEDGSSLPSNWRKDILDLIAFVRAMAEKPVVDEKLGESLDIFMNKLQESQFYLNNGLMRIPFAEASLFLQTCVEAYGKKVDLVLYNAIQYQMQLSALNRNEEIPPDLSIGKLGRRTSRKSKTGELIHSFKSSCCEKLLITFRKHENFFREKPNLEWCDQLRDLYDRAYHTNNSTKSDWRNISGVGVVRYISRVNRTGLNTDGSVNNEFVRASCLTMKAVAIIERSPTVVNNKPVAIGNDEIYSPSAVRRNTTIDTISDHGYDSNHSYVSSSILHSRQKSDDESGTFSRGGSHLFMEEDDNDNNIESLTIPEEDENMESAACAATEQSIELQPVDTLKDISKIDTPKFNPFVRVLRLSITSSGGTNCDSGIWSPVNVDGLNRRHHFDPMFISTPKRKVPVVNIERLTRKRIRQLDKSLKQANTKRVRRITHIRPICTVPEKTFEDYYVLNYALLTRKGNDSDNEDDDFDTAAIDNVQEAYNVDVCETSVMEVIDDINAQIEAPCIDLQEDQAAEECPPDQISNVGEQHPSDDCNHEVLSSENDVGLNELDGPSASELQCQNVNDWRKNVIGFINRDKTNPKFSLRKYGGKIMDAIPTEKNLAFHDLVRGKSSTEVVRYFITALHLVNTSNIELVDTCPGTLANEELKIKLLTKDRYHEKLNKFIPPSETINEQKLAIVKAMKRTKQQSSFYLDTQPSTSQAYLNSLNQSSPNDDTLSVNSDQSSSTGSDILHEYKHTKRRRLQN